MRVLWVCNIMLPVIAEALHREASNKEGWLSGLLSQIVDREDIGMTLAVAFPVPAGEEIPQSFVVRVQGNTLPVSRKPLLLRKLHLLRRGAVDISSDATASMRIPCIRTVTSRSWKKNCVRSWKIMIRM